MDAFSVRTKIMIGGGMDALAQRLHRVFLVTDKFMDESGKTNYVTDRLLRSSGEFKIFSDVQADPDIATVTRGVEQILEFQPDAVVPSAAAPPSTRPRQSCSSPPGSGTCGTASSSPSPPPAAPARR